MFKKLSKSFDTYSQRYRSESGRKERKKERKKESKNFQLDKRNKNHDKFVCEEKRAKLIKLLNY